MSVNTLISDLQVSVIQQLDPMILNSMDSEWSLTSWIANAADKIYIALLSTFWINNVPKEKSHKNFFVLARAWNLSESAPWLESALNVAGQKHPSPVEKAMHAESVMGSNFAKPWILCRANIIVM